MRWNFLFLTFVMVITTGMTVVYYTAKDSFGDSVTIRRENKRLSAQLARSELQEQILSERYYDYAQNVAKVLGQREKNLANWSELNLLHVSRMPAADHLAVDSNLLLSRGKALFADGDYAKAAATFLDLEKRYPGAPGVIEGRFLRAESYYLLGQTDQCLTVIDEMMNFYPDHPMTGYLMLRLSQVLHYRKRTPEALDVLEMIRNGFSDVKDLVTQVSLLEKKFRSL